MEQDKNERVKNNYKKKCTSSSSHWVRVTLTLLCATVPELSTAGVVSCSVNPAWPGSPHFTLIVAKVYTKASNRTVD